jgi:hypothetical protein
LRLSGGKLVSHIPCALSYAAKRAALQRPGGKTTLTISSAKKTHLMARIMAKQRIILYFNKLNVSKSIENEK